MNNDFVLSSADALSDRAREEGGGEFDANIRRAFELVYGRGPEPAEAQLAHQAIESATDTDAAWRTLCQALLASNEFLYVF